MPTNHINNWIYYLISATVIYRYIPSKKKGDSDAWLPWGTPEKHSVNLLFSPRDTYSHRKYQERLDEGGDDEQRESDHEKHFDRMNDLVSESSMILW